MKKVTASVIIPNWNGKALLEECLDSLEKQTFKEFEIIVVDNGSIDGSVDFIIKNFPGVKVVKLDKNYGFSKAINAGVEASQALYVVFLNNDTAVDKDWLKILVSYANKYQKASSIGSKLVNYYNRKKIDGVGIEINEVGQAKSIGWNQEDLGQFDKEMFVFGVTGGGSLFRREVFIKLGMFDEDYFMYFEEVDFAFRAQFQGYKAIYCPKAVIYHRHKATSSKKPQYIEYWQFKNMMQTIIKDYPGSLLFKDKRWLKIILVNFNTCFYQLKNGFFWPPILTQAWLIFNLPKLLLKRRKIQEDKKVSDEYIEKFFLPKKISFWGLR